MPGENSSAENCYSHFRPKRSLHLWFANGDFQRFKRETQKKNEIWSHETQFGISRQVFRVTGYQKLGFSWYFGEYRETAVLLWSPKIHTS